MVRPLKRRIFIIFELLISATKTIFFIPRGCCRFYPTCTEFSREAFIMLPPHKSIPVIVKRLLRCNPFNRCGYDPFIEEQYINIQDRKHE